MSEAFDPYYKWLGIPRKDQPPDHYRLLGIERFEADADVITHAADQRMGHLKAFQAGKHSGVTQQLLNQIAAAKLCLLNDESRRLYDRRLRADQRDVGDPPAFEPDDGASPSARGVAGDWLPARWAVRLGTRCAVGAAVLLCGWMAWQLWGGGTRSGQDQSPSIDGMSRTAPDAVPAPRRTTSSTASPGDRATGLAAADSPPSADDPSAPPAGLSPGEGTNDTAVPGGRNKTESTANGPRSPEAPAAATSGDGDTWAKLARRRAAAVAAGDFDAATKIIARMGELRPIDMLDEQAEVLRQCRTTLGAAAPREARRELARQGIALLRAAVAARRTDLLERLGNPVLLLARGSEDAELVRAATLLIVELQDLAGAVSPQPPSNIADNEGP